MSHIVPYLAGERGHGGFAIGSRDCGNGTRLMVKIPPHNMGKKPCRYFVPQPDDIALILNSVWPTQNGNSTCLNGLVNVFRPVNLSARQGGKKETSFHSPAVSRDPGNIHITGQYVIPEQFRKFHLVPFLTSIRS